MRSFQYTEQGKQFFRDLLDAHERYVMDNIEKVDDEIANQHSRLYKSFCFAWWGHLYDKNLVCKRCGHVHKAKEAKVMGVIESSLKNLKTA